MNIISRYKRNPSYTYQTNIQCTGRCTFINSTGLEQLTFFIFFFPIQVFPISVTSITRTIKSSRVIDRYWISNEQKTSTHGIKDKTEHVCTHFLYCVRILNNQCGLSLKRFWNWLFWYIGLFNNMYFYNRATYLP